MLKFNTNLAIPNNTPIFYNFESLCEYQSICVVQINSITAYSNQVHLNNSSENTICNMIFQNYKIDRT